MNSPNKTPRKRKSNSLTTKSLSYFTKIDTEDGESPYKKTHKCNICKETFCGKKEWNLSRHLSNNHAEVYAEISMEQSEHPAVSRQKLLQQCVEIVGVNGRAFKTLLDSGFQAIIQSKLSQLQASGHGLSLTDSTLHDVKKQLQNTAKKIREKISAEVKSIPLSLLIDIVTKHGRSILGISVQYSVKGCLKVRSIGMIELRKSHTAKYLAELIIARLKDFDIQLSQIFTITTDNGKNVLKMVRDIEQHLHNEITKTMHARRSIANDFTENNESSNSAIDTDVAIETLLAQSTEMTDEEALGLIYQEFEVNADSQTLLNAMTVEMTMFGADFLFDITGINCAVHTLQLAIKDALAKLNKTESNVIQLCRQVSKLLRLYSTSDEMHELGIHYRLPRLETPTRWGSMYIMVSYFHK